MTTIALPRIELPSVDFTAVADVLKRASERLGYTLGTDLIQENTLMKVLAERNVLPFSPTAVKEYKARRQHEARRQAGLYWFNPNRTYLKWRTCSVNRFSEAIPISVLKLANDLQHYFGGVNLNIDYLSEDDMEVKYARTYDPFLMVRASRTSKWHHVAVWDEPTFEG